jgi:hypothetical protein
MRNELAARTTAETDSARRAPALHAGCRARCRASAFRHALRHAECIRWARDGERVGASDSERVTQVSKEVAEATPHDVLSPTCSHHHVAETTLLQLLLPLHLLRDPAGRQPSLSQQEDRDTASVGPTQEHPRQQTSKLAASDHSGWQMHPTVVHDCCGSC